MKALKILVLVGIFSYVLATSTSTASEIVHEFKNPSFSGTGYSSHVLSIEQLQHNRKNEAKDDAKSAVAAATRAENNTTIAKFIKNVESYVRTNYRITKKQMESLNKVYKRVSENLFKGDENETK